MGRQWKVEFHNEFLPEFREFPAPDQRELAARLERLKEQGPLLGRPYVDTLKGAKHANMKELRFDADGGAWRVALPSIFNEVPFCWLEGIRPGLPGTGSIRTCFELPISALRNT